MLQQAAGNRLLSQRPCGNQTDNIMFLNFGIVINAVLMVLGILWCREMFGRWRNDLDEFRSTKDASTRQVLIALWLVTALVGVLLLNFLVGIRRNVGIL